jgi:ABC-2 type transport system ATP-binding protein
MRVVEYLRYRAELKGVASRDIGRRVDTALGQASVSEVASRIIGQLSKGTRQRVGLADALVADPPLLVLDEPTAGLDPNQIRQVRELIKGFAKTKTVLVSTHILPEVEATCERVVIIHKGRVVQEGAPDELMAAPTAERLFVLRSRASAADLEKALAGLSGLRGIDAKTVPGGEIAQLAVRVADEADDVGERIFLAVASAGLSLRSLTEQSKGASLEDVFSQLTRADAAKPAVDYAADDEEDEDEADATSAAKDGDE